jgi:hypothetical protein
MAQGEYTQKICLSCKLENANYSSKNIGGIFSFETNSLDDDEKDTATGGRQELIIPTRDTVAITNQMIKNNIVNEPYKSIDTHPNEFKYICIPSIDDNEDVTEFEISSDDLTEGEIKHNADNADNIFNDNIKLVLDLLEHNADANTNNKTGGNNTLIRFISEFLQIVILFIKNNFMLIIIILVLLLIIIFLKCESHNMNYYYDDL